MSSHRPTKRTVAATFGIALAAALAVRGQAYAQQPGQLAVLFMRVLSYDRALKSRAGAELTVAVVYRSGDAGSEAVGSAVAAKLDEIRRRGAALGLPMRVVSMAYGDASSFDSKLVSEKASAVYVCPGLDDHIGQISAVTRKRSVLSVTATEEYVQGGLAVGLMPRSSKSMVVVNLPAAKAEGADLDSALLSIARVMR